MEPRLDGSSASKRKEISKEQWEELKPLIRRLYVDENMTRQSVTKYLVEEHNFEPTKRQFSRKISDWGFEKNVKKAERRSILLDSVTDEGRLVRGRKLDKAKLDRWSRRDGIPLQHHGLGKSDVNNTSDVKFEHDSILAMMDNLIIASPDDGSTLHAMNDQDIEEMNMNSRIQDLVTDDIQNLFNPWEMINFGSPQLAGLLGALTIECEGFWLDDTADVPNSEDVFGISEAISNTNTKAPVQEDLVSVSIEMTRFAAPTCNKYVVTIPAWTMSNSPSIGLSPFPTSTAHSNKGCFESSSLDRPSPRFESNCKARMRKLSKMKAADILDLVADMFSVTHCYYDLEDYKMAEHWYRRIVTAKLHIPKSKPLDTIRACLFIVECLILQGRYKEAHCIHLGLHEKIMRLFQYNPDHELSILSRSSMADLLYEFGNLQQAELIQREILQILLNTYGPRNSDCLNAMNAVAYSIMHGGQNFLGEQLFRIVLQMATQVPGYSPSNGIDRKNRFLSQSGLIRTLNRGGKVAEAEVLLRHISETLPDLVRVENIISREYYYELAYTRRLQGRLDESEKMLRDMLCHQESFLIPNERVDILGSLGDCAWDSGRGIEAASWYAKAYVLNVEIYGPEHEYSISRCKVLGVCYTRQGLFDEAISCFRKAISEIVTLHKVEEDSPNTNVSKIQGWIETVKMDKCKAVGFAWVSQGLFDKAISHFEQAVDSITKISPDDDTSYNDKMDRLQRWMEKVRTDKCKAVGFGLVDQGLFQDAILYFKQALDATTKRAQGGNAAIVELSAGSLERIRRWVLTTTAEESLESCRNAGMDYAAQGLYDIAILHFQQAIETACSPEQTETNHHKECIRTLEHWIREVQGQKARSLNNIVATEVSQHSEEAMDVDG